MIGKIILIIIMVSLSAFFSASEIALISLSKAKIQSLVERKRKNANILKDLRSNTHKLLITILVGNNFVNISASMIGLLIGTELFLKLGFTLTDAQIGGVITGLLTLIILVFGEIFPKTIATSYSEFIALNVAFPMKLFVILFTPITFFLDLINKLFFFIFRIKRPNKTMITEDELITMTRLGAEQGAIKQREKEFINNIFNFDNIEAKEVMTPRNYTTAIDINTPIYEVIKIINETEFSRIPVYKKRLDRIKGVLYAKDLFYLLSKKTKTKKISSIMKPAIFVPENMKIDKIFRLMQNKNTHIVFVVNEYGGLSGIITLEDLIEELVGEIYDESDEKKENIKKISKNEYLVEGITPLEEINEKLKIPLPSKEEYLTIAGFIMEKLGRMPKEKEAIEEGNIKIKIIKASKRRIITVKITKKE